MFRVLCSLLLILGLVGVSFSQVRKSGEWIVTRREHSILDRLETSFSFPNTTMADGQLVAFLNIEGPNLTAMIVGPVKGNAKSYAQVLEDWRVKSSLPGEVVYSQEDDCAAARLIARTGGFGKMEATLKVPAAQLLVQIQALNPKARTALLAPVWTNLNIAESPGFTAKNGNRIWDITGETSLEPIESKLSVPGWIIPALIAWIFLPIVGLIFCFGIGFTIAKDAKRPIEQRRKIYSTLVGKGTFVVLGLHAILVIATLPTRALDPVSQLWFGFRFSQIGLFVVPLFGILPMAMLPWLNKMETKLLGATPEEQATREDFSQYNALPVVEEATKKKKFPYTILILALGLVLIFWPLDKNSPLVPFQRLAAPICIVATFIPTFRNQKKLTASLEADVPNQAPMRMRVEEHSRRLGQQMNVTVPPVKIGPLLQGPYGAAISLSKLYVSPALADRFTDGELDFVLAHELAHLKQGHLKWKWIIAFAPMIVIFPLMLLVVFRKSFSITISPSFIFSPFLLLLVLLPLSRWLISRMSVKHEFECDAIAVQTTKDKESAIQALVKMAEQNSLPGFDEDAFGRTHPKHKDRIERIRALSL